MVREQLFIAINIITKNAIIGKSVLYKRNKSQAVVRVTPLCIKLHHTMPSLILQQYSP